MSELEHVLACRDELGEGPLWNPREQALFWVDILKGLYHRYEPISGAHEIVHVGEQIGVLAFRDKGGLVIAGARGFAFFDPISRTLERITDPEADKPQTRFNDGAVDRKGRFWAGTLGDKFRNNSLYRLDPDLSLRRMESGVDISNGIGWSPDNRIMYYADTTPGKVYAYDFDLESGEIANRRVFIDRPQANGGPDGLIVDAEGAVWIAVWGDFCVERYDPAGKRVLRIDLPVQCPTKIAFGGPNLDELYITSSLTGVPKEARAGQPLAGDLFRVRGVGVGLPEPYFLG
jgi:sugar lactone lactonase YvrE